VKSHVILDYLGIGRTSFNNS